MKYATAEDILSEISLGELAEYIADGAEYDAIIASGALSESGLQLVDRALLDASHLIDSYIFARYAQLDTIPLVLVKICARLALGYIVERRFVGNSQMAEWVKGSRKEQIDLLANIASGAISLVISDNSSSNGAVVIVSERNRRLGAVINELDGVI